MTMMAAIAMPIYGKSPLYSPEALETWHGPSGTKFLQVYRNNAPWLTMTYFTACSNVTKTAYCAYSRYSCKVSVYMTIGLLV